MAHGVVAPTEDPRRTASEDGLWSEDAGNRCADPPGHCLVEQLRGEVAGLFEVGRNAREGRHGVFADEFVVVNADDRDVVRDAKPLHAAGLQDEVARNVVGGQDAAGTRQFAEPGADAGEKGGDAVRPARIERGERPARGGGFGGEHVPAASRPFPGDDVAHEGEVAQPQRDQFARREGGGFAGVVLHAEDGLPEERAVGIAEDHRDIPEFPGSEPRELRHAPLDDASVRLPEPQRARDGHRGKSVLDHLHAPAGLSGVAVDAGETSPPQSPRILEEEDGFHGSSQMVGGAGFEPTTAWV